MGRNAGFLTLHSGIAGGADTILLPEFPVHNTQLLKHVEEVYKKHECAVVVVSEAIRLSNSGKTSKYVPMFVPLQIIVLMKKTVH
jgi:6-phosphofructokinase 1